MESKINTQITMHSHSVDFTPHKKPLKTPTLKSHFTVLCDN